MGSVGALWGPRAKWGSTGVSWGLAQRRFIGKNSGNFFKQNFFYLFLDLKSNLKKSLVSSTNRGFHAISHVIL